MRLRKGVEALSNTGITFGLRVAEAEANKPIIEILRQLGKAAIPPPQHQAKNRANFLTEAERLRREAGKTG